MYEFDERRLEKLALLREEGITPYPHNLRTTHTCEQVRALIGERSNEELALDETVVVTAGRLLFKNEMGKAGFGRLRDRSGRVQFFIKKNKVSEESFQTWRRLDSGDHVWVRGRLMRTRTGEPTISVEELVLASKCISSLPDKHKGVEDPEFRQRHRYVDLFMGDESREVFIARSKIVRAIRRFFDAREFLEVETPMMQVIPGGAAARPFITHHNALDIDLYLRVAPELFLKRLVVGGLERVYEINRNFRNEGVSVRHNPEFTMLEFYQAYATWHDLMELTEELIESLAVEVTGGTKVTYGDLELEFARPWRRASMAELIMEKTGLTAEQMRDPEALRARWLQDHPDDAKHPKLPSTWGKWYEWYFDAYVEDEIVQPTFVTHFPTEISPLSRRSDEDPEIADRFEIICAGREIGNAFNELNDPVDQAARFTDQAQDRADGDDEAMFFDADYVKALSYGMPPTAGEGIGIDRLVMLLTDRHTIRDVILFPTLRPLAASGAATDADEADAT